MSWIDGMKERMRWLTRGRAAEGELDEEFAFHIDMETQKNMAAGMPAEAARRAAERTLGNVVRTKEAVREERGIGFIDDALHDLRYALRGLRAHPAFTAAAVATLALGIGANTAVFSAVHGVLWRPLGYEDPNALVAVWPNNFTSMREMLFLQENSETLEDIASYAPWTVALTDTDNPTQLNAARTSANFFQALGVDPAVGRTFRPEDDELGAAPVAVISHALWRGQFGGDSSIVGRTMRIDGTATTVVGVMKAEFEIFGPDRSVWIPLIEDPDDWTYGANVSLLFARLAPRASVLQADVEFRQLLTRMREHFGFDNEYGNGAAITDLKSELVGSFEVLLYVLLGAVGLILLVAGTNLGTLLLARANSRRSEMAMRLTLGATPRRVLKQLITESVLLSAMGGILGLIIAFGGIAVLKGIVPDDTPRLAGVTVNGTVLLVCAVVAFGTGLVFSIIPAFALIRGGRETLHEARSGARHTSGRRIDNAFVAVQLALAVMLVIGAGLMIRTLGQLSAVDTGFEYRQVLTMRVHLAGDRYPDAATRHEFFRAALERVQSIPGVETVGAIQHLPLSGSGWSTEVELEGRPLPPGDRAPLVGYRIVTEQYFAALQIPLIEGRTFEPTDDGSSESVAIINRAMADQLWLGESALNQRFQQRNVDGLIRVVGVVDNVQHWTIEGDPGAALFRPYRQSSMGAMMLAARTVTDPRSLAAAAQQEIWAIDPNTPISRVEPYDQLVRATFGDRRLLMVLLVAFGSVALALGAIGVYGVTSFAVSRRTTEIGIRMAIGASHRAVQGEVLRRGVTLIVGGIAIGLLAAYWLTRFLREFVYGVTTTDVATFVSVAALMGLVGLGATYVPARRATRIDPVIALRD